jgi:Domain of unknown function (DUF5615)
LKVRFLLDENLLPRLKTALLRLNPQIDVTHVGEPSAPPTGTLDPEILIYLEASQRLLVTDDRSSMPGHLTDCWNAGGHIWGLLWVRSRTPLSKLAQDLLLVWDVTEAEEWCDRLDWIQF